MNKLSMLGACWLAVMVLAGCSPKTGNQLKNQQITSHEGEPILVGLIDRAGLQQAPYDFWFNDFYGNYTVDRAALEPVKEELLASEIRLFLGTWCSDSQMQVPQFYKILDEMGYDADQLIVVSLDNHPDRYKTSPGGEEKEWDIYAVPTFIFLQNGEEVGRIVEYPEQTLEKDMARILVD